MTKQQLALAILSGSIAASPLVSADWYGQPYIGMNLGSTKMGFKEDYGRDVFSNAASVYSFNVGTNVNEWFAVELGYESSHATERTKISRAPSVTFPGSSTKQTGSQFTVFNSTWQKRNVLLKLIAQAKLPVNFIDITGFGYVGASYSRLSARYFVVDNDTAGTPTLAEMLNSQRVFKKKRPVAIAGVGLRYDITPCWGIKTEVSWRGTSAFKKERSRNKPSSFAAISANDSTNLELGLRYTF